MIYLLNRFICEQRHKNLSKKGGSNGHFGMLKRFVAVLVQKLSVFRKNLCFMTWNPKVIVVAAIYVLWMNSNKCPWSWGRILSNISFIWGNGVLRKTAFEIYRPFCSKCQIYGGDFVNSRFPAAGIWYTVLVFIDLTFNHRRLGFDCTFSSSRASAK